MQLSETALYAEEKYSAFGFRESNVITAQQRRQTAEREK
jgi:hypothetical protein